MAATAEHQLTNRWDKASAPKGGLDLLVYASNLLGSDPAITNFGGGNTSSKTQEIDPLTGDSVEVLWVKASGGDLGTAKSSGFASLYQQKLLGLEARSKAGVHEDEMVPLYAQSTFNLNPAAPSIDTPLHGFVPYPCVSHMHPDAVIAVAASENSREVTKNIYGDRMGFLPWKRPGFDLGLALRDLIAANPNIEGAVMESHGLICWANTWEECYDLTLKLIDEAQAYIDANGRKDPFGKPVRTVREADAADKLVALIPELRGKVVYDGQPLIAHVTATDPLMEFLASEHCERLVALGTSCPDHFLRTKIRPMLLKPDDDLDAALADFRRAGYEGYYKRCKQPDSPAMRNPNPSVVLVPGVGMITFGKNATEARVTGEFYCNAVNVMRGAEAIARYVSLPEQEAFNIEYWQLEEAKLRRQPPEKELSRRVAVISGGAQGIGRATALKLTALGASCSFAGHQRDQTGRNRRPKSKRPVAARTR